MISRDSARSKTDAHTCGRRFRRWAAPRPATDLSSCRLIRRAARLRTYSDKVIAKAKAEAADPDAQWIDVGTIRTSSKECPECDGTGRVEIDECPECDGYGEFDHGSRTRARSAMEAEKSLQPEAARCAMNAAGLARAWPVAHRHTAR
ncbi:MAG: hypothetical protein IPK53_10995 [bacterium]|nr:hypothetical protein [bacterium]